MLQALGYELEPSDWLRMLTGGELHTGILRFDPQPGIEKALADMRRVVAGYPWPCLVVDGECRIAAVSRAAARLLGDDLVPGRARGAAQNLVRLALGKRFRDHVLNWDEVITALLPSTLRTLFSTDRRAAAEQLDAIVADVRREDPSLVERLQRLWQEEPRLSARIVFPLLWQTDAGATLTFHAILSPWLPFRPYWALDLYPADAETCHLTGTQESEVSA